MCAMPDQNGTAMPAPSEGAKSSYVGSCPGILRIFICVLGLGALILGCIGAPNDLGGVTGDSQSAIPSDFYGDGLGYVPAEPLNALYIALLVIAWALTLGFLAVSFRKSYGEAPKWNRVLYLVAGIIAWIACICGAVGTFLFWGGCCHVFLPVRGERYLQFHQNPTEGGYRDWCACTLKVMRGNQYRYLEIFQWRQEYMGLEIMTATPHHFVVHILSMVCTALFGILCFVACCFS